MSDEYETTGGESRTFTTEEILAVVMDKAICDSAGVIDLLEFIGNCKLSTKEEIQAARERLAPWISSQLGWVAAGESISLKTDFADWLRSEVSTHGGNHQLRPKPCGGVKFDWMKNTHSAAFDAVEGLVRLARKGNLIAKRSLLDLANGIIRELHDNHADLIPQSEEFPVVLWAQIDDRRSQLNHFAHLPIGINIGFPKARPGGRPPKTGPTSPAFFWRSIQEPISALRTLTSQCEGNFERLHDDEGLPWCVTDDLLSRIANLENFGSSANADKIWLEVAKDLVLANDDHMIPDWVNKRVTSGKSPTNQRQNPWENELEKGFKYCTRHPQK